MSTTPTPAQLADWLDNEVPGGGFHFNQQLELCCAELRRLAAVEDGERKLVEHTSRQRAEILSLLAERDQFRAEVEKLRADAERYRWLRGDGAEEFGHPRWERWQVQAWGGNPLHWMNLSGGALDAAVDKARKA